MPKRLMLGILALVLLLAVPLAGCQSGATVTTTATVTAPATTVTTTTTATVTATATDTAAVNAVQQKLDAADQEIAALKAKYVLTGNTTADTVANVARYYHETHTYTATDMFVCGNMAEEIWNMLKTLGINSIIAVGRVDQSVTNILDSNHAWLLAEVEPGKYLAVECTGGYTVTAAQNPLYYQGWYYDSPETLNTYFDEVKEYNTRVDMANQVVTEDQQVVAQYNSSGSPSLLAVHNELNKLLTTWKDQLDQLMTKINTAATPLTFSQ